MKARQGMDLIVKQCHLLFKKEWISILAQHRYMRDALFTAEQQLLLAES